MKAMLLAAGRGERLRPLSDRLPKPLLPIGETTLIERHIDRLREAGITELVINLHYLGDMIATRLGDGSDHGVRIEYSHEHDRLDTGGGVKHALGLLGDTPFAVVSADIYTDFDYRSLNNELPLEGEARLFMVPNPPHHPKGDFDLDSSGRLGDQRGKLTYSGIGVLHPRLFVQESAKQFPLRRVMDAAAARNALFGVTLDSFWCDVGTIERYEALLNRIGVSPLQNREP